MTHLRARALRLGALLAIPASLSAQSRRSPTVFSASAQPGTVALRAAVVLDDYTVKPLPLLRVVARRADRADSVVAQTDLDGRVTLSMVSGAYTIHAKTSKPIEGRTYEWAVPAVVRAGRVEAIQLTNENASSGNAAPTTVSAAPRPSGEVARTVQQPVPPSKVATSTKPSEPAAEVVSPFAPPSTPMPAQSAPVSAPSPVRPAAPAPRRSVPVTPRANTSGLLLGLSLGGSSIRSDDLNSSRESGAGASAQLGWGLTRNFALLLDVSGARIESVGGDFDLAHVDIGGRWHFVSDSRALVPFLQVGVSGRAAGRQNVFMADEMGNVYEGDLRIVGGGVSVGGGLQYFVSPKWALGGQLEWTTGSFTRVQFNNVSVDGLRIDATSARVNMGFTWFPIGRAR